MRRFQRPATILIFGLAILALSACSRHFVERSFESIDIDAAPQEVQTWIGGISSTDEGSYIMMVENEEDIVIYLFVDSVGTEEGKAIKVRTVGIHSMGKNGLEIEVRYEEASEEVDRLLEITAPKDQLELLRLNDASRGIEDITVVEE